MFQTRMIWECSECGSRVERVRAPVRCDDCGMVAAFFAVPHLSDGADVDRTAAWFYAGMEKARDEAPAFSSRLD